MTSHQKRREPEGSRRVSLKCWNKPINKEKWNTLGELSWNKAFPGKQNPRKSILADVCRNRGEVLQDREEMIWRGSDQPRKEALGNLECGNTKSSSDDDRVEIMEGRMVFSEGVCATSTRDSRVEALWQHFLSQRQINSVRCDLNSQQGHQDPESSCQNHKKPWGISLK